MTARRQLVTVNNLRSPAGRIRISHRLLCACFLLQLTACALRPDWQQLAADGNLESRWIDAGQFRHLVLWNEHRGDHLRIYVDGDGTPWIRNTRVAVDPTPANPVLLRLMHDAAHPAVYLGRPCYFGTSTDQECEQRWWTFDRYGQVVVDSMCKAANRISAELGADTVGLIGYSGGGAIVVGMSACTARLVSVTTIAGNLDPQAWAEHHRYSALHDLAPLSQVATAQNRVHEAHWQCRGDLNIPPSVTDEYFVDRAGAIRHIIDSCTHSTGWEQQWPLIIELPAIH